MIGSEFPGLDCVKFPNHFICLKHVLWDFPGGPVVKNPPSNAGDAGSIPGQRTKIPPALGQQKCPIV